MPLGPEEVGEEDQGHLLLQEVGEVGEELRVKSRAEAVAIRCL